jgi:hypothetical protein
MDGSFMLSDLYDHVSKLFSRRWPTAEGEITAVNISYGGYGYRGGNRVLVIIDYKFRTGGGELYTGEASWSPWFGSVNGTDINDQLCLGEPVTVRFRRDDPSVNRLDRSVWEYLGGL